VVRKISEWQLAAYAASCVLAGGDVTSLNADVVIVGCGDLGSALARQCQSVGLQVLGLRRHPTQHDFPCLQADITQAESLNLITQSQAKVVVYCVAATEQSDANYYQQYVLGLQHTLQAINTMPQAPLVMFVSSTRMYGQDSDVALDEQSPALHSDFGGQRLMQAETLLKDMPHAVVLRLTGIYGPGRNRLLHWASQPSLWPSENKWTNRIHRDDAAGFMLHLIQRYLANTPLQPCYIVTDQQPASMYEVLHYFAQRLGVATPAHTPAVTGRFFSNQRMLDTGYRLRYPDYRSGGYAISS
jgi:nucleoside-diphosphate-sugar epimerase